MEGVIKSYKEYIWSYSLYPKKKKPAEKFLLLKYFFLFNFHF